MQQTNTMTRNQADAVAALIAKLDAGVAWPAALFLICDQHNISEGHMRYLYDYSTEIEVQS